MGRYTGKTCRLIFMLVLTVVFFVAELVSGYIGNSIALISDSFNMLSDLISLCVGITASRISRRTKWGPRVTYGYARAEVVGALSNAVFLTALCFTILVDSVLRLAKPERIDDPQLVLIVGTLGLGVNIVGLLVFQDYGSCIRAIQKGTGSQDTEIPARSSNDQINSNPHIVNIRAVESEDLGRAGDPIDNPNSDPEKDKNAKNADGLNIRGDAIEDLNDVQEEDKKANDVADLNIKGDPIEDPVSDLEDDRKAKDAAALNIRGVLLHIMGDALGSVVAVVAAVIFYVKELPPDVPCNWQCYIDPSLTIVMVGIILFSAFPLIKETAFILLQMVPEGVNVGDIGQKIALVPGVRSLHEIHVWELASGKAIATVHIKFQTLCDYLEANGKIRKIFHSEGVHAVTLQAEFTHDRDISMACNNPCVSKKCDTFLCCSQELVPHTETNGNALKNRKSSRVWYINNDFDALGDPLADIGPLEVRVITNGLN